jgi:sulfur carrier protein
MTGPPSDSPLAQVDLVVNGAPTTLPEATSLDALVDRLGIAPQGVAIALDGQVVPRSQWRVTTLAAGVHVEIVTAAAGG